MERHRPKKALGQNFLVDRNVLDRIVEAVAIAPDDAVLEIGPGRGALTTLLAERATRVMAVELDRDLVPVLRKLFVGRPNVEIIPADILAVDLPALLSAHGAQQWKVAANLPYNISSQVLFRFLDHPRLFASLVLMFQREVGERLLASPATKEYGILSVFCRLHFDISRVLLVRPGGDAAARRVRGLGDPVRPRLPGVPFPVRIEGDRPLPRHPGIIELDSRREIRTPDPFGGNLSGQGPVQGCVPARLRRKRPKNEIIKILNHGK